MLQGKYLCSLLHRHVGTKYCPGKIAKYLAPCYLGTYGRWHAREARYGTRYTGAKVYLHAHHPSTAQAL